MEREGLRETMGHLSSQGIPPLMTRKYVANYLGIAESTLRRMISSGKLQTVDNKITIKHLADYMCRVDRR